MGRKTNSPLLIHIEDRALAHLKVVIATKLRRNESFTVSWQHPDDQPRGRSTLWLHPSIPLRFRLRRLGAAVLSRAWIEELANSEFNVDLDTYPTFVAGFDRAAATANVG
jgi:hypothetical protein